MTGQIGQIRQMGRLGAAPGRGCGKMHMWDAFLIHVNVAMPGL